MKKIIPIIFCFLSISSFATQITISTTGDFSFNPNDVTINQGDTVIFNVGASHTATEVTQTTWNANGNMSNGGFNLGVGNNQQVINLSVGTHFYVCQPHASSGMKGRITVNLTAGTKNKTAENNLLKIFPNPTKDFLMINLDGISLNFNRITITNLEGKIVKEIAINITDKIFIDDLPNSEYILTVYTKQNEVYVQKFIKE